MAARAAPGNTPAWWHLPGVRTEQAAVYQPATQAPLPSSGAAGPKKESAPIHRKSGAGPRGAAVTDCQGPGRSPVCGGGVGLPRLRGHHGTARVPESPTRTPPPQSHYNGLPQDHLLRRASSQAAGPNPPGCRAAQAHRLPPRHARNLSLHGWTSRAGCQLARAGGGRPALRWTCAGVARSNATRAPRLARGRFQGCIKTLS